MSPSQSVSRSRSAFRSAWAPSVSVGVSVSESTRVGVIVRVAVAVLVGAEIDGRAEWGGIAYAAVPKMAAIDPDGRKEYRDGARCHQVIHRKLLRSIRQRLRFQGRMPGCPRTNRKPLDVWRSVAATATAYRLQCARACRPDPAGCVPATCGAAPCRGATSAARVAARRRTTSPKPSARQCCPGRRRSVRNTSCAESVLHTSIKRSTPEARSSACAADIPALIDPALEPTMTSNGATPRASRRAHQVAMICHARGAIARQLREAGSHASEPEPRERRRLPRGQLPRPRSLRALGPAPTGHAFRERAGRSLALPLLPE